MRIAAESDCSICIGNFIKVKCITKLSCDELKKGEPL
jgi:hypothetical protein